MKKVFLLLCGMLVAAVSFGENFPNDFQAALKLVNEGKIIEAEEAFLKLAGQKAGKRATDESMAQAAYCALAQKKFDQAVEYAGKIGDKPLGTLCRMKILQKQNKWDEILSLSKSEEIDKWPDAMIYDGMLCRGRAYAARQEAPGAEKDFVAAGKNTLSADDKAFAMQNLGDLYREVVKDNCKASETYAAIIKMQGIHPNRLRGAATSLAKLLAAEGRGDEAVTALDGVKADKDKDFYRYSSLQMCYGEVYEIIGKKPEALARYKAVAGLEKANADLREKAQRKIEELEKEQGK